MTILLWGIHSSHNRFGTPTWRTWRHVEKLLTYKAEVEHIDIYLFILSPRFNNEYEPSRYFRYGTVLHIV